MHNDYPRPEEYLYKQASEVCAEICATSDVTEMSKLREKLGKIKQALASLE